MLLRFGSDGRQLNFDVGVPDALHKGVGVHRLRFPLRYDTRGTLPTGIPIHVQGQVWLAVQSDWLGFAQPDVSIITGPHGEALAVLVLTLSDDQLAVIEDRRAGSDLQLRVDVHLTLGYDPGPMDSEAAGARGGHGEPWPSALAEFHPLVQSGQWERLLTQVAAGSSLAIVVPVPLGRDSAQTRAGEQLREAIRKVNAGEYEDAVINARKAIEALDHPWASEKSITSQVPVMSDRTFSQRRTMLRHALFSLASMAAHGDSSEDIAWTRASALSVVAAVSALVATADK